MSTKVKYGIKDYEKDFGRPTFGEVLEAWRLSDGLSLKEMAGKLSISASSLCDLEKGRRIPSIARVRKIANVLGVSEIVWISHIIQDQLDRENLNFKVHLEEDAS